MKKNFVLLLIVIALALSGCGASIPDQGEFADSTLPNARFILDYQKSSGGNYLATITVLYPDWNCYAGEVWVQRLVVPASMAIDSSGNVTITSAGYSADGAVPVNGLDFDGHYDGTDFILTTNDIRDHGPVTMTFAPYPNKDALSVEQSQIVLPTCPTTGS